MMSDAVGIEQQAEAVATNGFASTVLVSAVPRLAFSPAEAAVALGIARSTFDTEVLPHLRFTRLGRRILIDLEELRRWLRDTGKFSEGHLR